MKIVCVKPFFLLKNFQSVLFKGELAPRKVAMCLKINLVVLIFLNYEWLNLQPRWVKFLNYKYSVFTLQ